MKFSLLEKKGDSKAVLKLTDASVAFANALRRAIINQLPCFAIDEVDFYENNSALYNEYIANRLGLIPLTYDSEVGDDKKISLTINTQGPGIVYSKDLISADELIKPLDDNFPIADLAEGQKLRVEAFAIKGTSKKHAKFQAAHASYGSMPSFKVKKNSPKLKEFLDSLPRKCFDEKGNVVAWKADGLEDFALDNPDIAEYSLDDDEFVFTVESYNNVPALEQLRCALKITAESASQAAKELK